MGSTLGSSSSGTTYGCLLVQVPGTLKFKLFWTEQMLPTHYIANAQHFEIQIIFVFSLQKNVTDL